MNDLDLLSTQRGLVVAPAGCGKTHLIVEFLHGHGSKQPVLVLTHTNAGVAALRQRLQRRGVAREKYRLATIDGWAMRLVTLFPRRSGHLIDQAAARPSYKVIRIAAWTLLKSGDIADELAATYSRLLVDEYQDCSVNQHAIVYFAAAHLPTCVLGDPMQSIFGFGDDPLADWDKHVRLHFPPVGELNAPWRWTNAGNTVLGEWLLNARRDLIAGKPIDISTAPPCVKWSQLIGDSGDHGRLVEAARCAHRQTDDTTLVIGDSRSASSRFRIAKSVPGITTVEPVDLGDMTSFARDLNLASPSSISQVLDFAESVITNVNASGVLSRINTLQASRERRGASDLEVAALAFAASPSLKGVSNLLDECARQSGSRTFRPAVLRSCHRAIQLSASNANLTFAEAAIVVREENRAVGRQLSKNAIGSTLLLKGLEADHVVVLNAGELDAKNLYVAMTRGAKSVTLCSREQLLCG